MAQLKKRIQGVSTEQTVRATATFLHRVILSNANAAAQILTLTDGAAIENVLRVGATATIVIDVGVLFDTSLKVTPSHADVDALILYD